MHTHQQLRAPRSAAGASTSPTPHAVRQLAQHERQVCPSAFGGRGRGGGGGRGDGGGLILGPGLGQTSQEFQDHMNARQGKKIIIPGGPGRSSGPPTGGPLFVPEEGSMGGAAGGILTDADSVTTPTPPSRYRPPAGFMNEKLNEDETANMPADVMLGRLQSRAGRWPTFAKMISNLYKQSYDSSVISEMTGISPAEQAKWVVAGTVYDSLKLSGRCSPEVLRAFEEGGENKLGFFRFINVDFRISAANYIVEMNLGIEVRALAMSVIRKLRAIPPPLLSHMARPGAQQCQAHSHKGGARARSGPLALVVRKTRSKHHGDLSPALACHPQECDTLARSMKEWERREGERDGFSNHPGDCLAFKCLRDVSTRAMETRRKWVRRDGGARGGESSRL
jgi:hypothetical protein